MYDQTTSSGKTMPVIKILDKYKMLGYEIKEVRPGVFHVYGPEYQGYGLILTPKGTASKKVA